MDDYTHLVQYYETDQMQIVHHSNYIRWFEEARGDYLSKRGIGYDWLESTGVLVPVLEVECKYLDVTRYADLVTIIPKITTFTGVKFEVEYEVLVDGKLKATGKSKHCFLDTNLRPISLKRKYPEVYQKYIDLL
ncbi:acyl-CoA thioesterase [Tannockella kyphosi]|uniref:acyl-CoA thioesterase n=1 Tax=Tannockella kyphosi TaxID=2899121 RepID=UPI002012A262|nr:acyl-CoA thioesterase [Tannockella kyphosi]